MLQIRLTKRPSADPGGGAPRAPAAAAAATVACPEHLVLADLPVAKSLGTVAVAAAAASPAADADANAAARPVGRRSRRLLGERVHICGRCDFPIAIYGRLIPCEHALCLTCARSAFSCFICDERIQKIQSIKMMEGMFICAAPRCLKSFLKRSEFETHIHETHPDLCQTSIEKEQGSEPDAVSIPQSSSTDIQKQILLPECSTAHAPSRSGFSLSSNSSVADRKDRYRYHQPGDQPHQNPNLQPNPPAFQANLSQGDSQPPRSDNQSAPSKPPPLLDAPFSGYPPLPHRPPNFAATVNANQSLEMGFRRLRDMLGVPFQGGLPFSAPAYSRTVPEGSSLNQSFPGKEIQGGSNELGEGKGVTAPMLRQLSLPSQSLPPPPPPPVLMRPHFYRANFSRGTS